ncbi:MAG TPA: arsenate reductase [Burkholderiales bacterium]|nr:arsenate reductase [Burkholderiales bacterium]
MITVYGIRNCTTMKKAFAWLEGRGIAYTLHDYKKSGAPADKVKTWIKQAGWERVLNTKGKTFRNLPPSRQQGLDAAKAAALMLEFPSAIKRPVIESGKTLLLGFDAEKYQSVLK